MKKFCYTLPMKIKKCSLDDILDLQKIYRQTFFETFSEQNSEENMRIFLDKAYSEEKLKSEIEDKESETFLAVENSLEIQRIYILKESKGLGIGTVFMNLAEKKVQGAWSFFYLAWRLGEKFSCSEILHGQRL